MSLPKGGDRLFYGLKEVFVVMSLLDIHIPPSLTIRIAGRFRQKVERIM